MAGLQVPLSTLRLAPRDALRMTRDQSGLLFLHFWRLSLFTLCRSPGAQAYDFFRFVRSGVLRRTAFNGAEEFIERSDSVWPFSEGEGSDLCLSKQYTLLCQTTTRWSQLRTRQL